LLEKHTFFKVGGFQALALILATLYTFASEATWEADADFSEQFSEQFSSGSGQLFQWGGRLPSLTSCQGVDHGSATTRYNMTGAFWEWSQEADTNASTLEPRDCWAFGLTRLGRGMGNFLAEQLAFDIVICNNIDIICPAWWIATKIDAAKAFYQYDYNKCFEGVDFHPYLRYQILLKFLWVSMTLNHLDFPRVLNFAVVICFMQCYIIDRETFLLRYRIMPQYAIGLISDTVMYALPIGLSVHCVMSFFSWCITYTHSSDKSAVEMHINWEYCIPVIPVAIMVLLFLVAWVLPLHFWKFHQSDAEFDYEDDFAGATDIRRRAHALASLRHIDYEKLCEENAGFLSYSEALQAKLDLQNGDYNVVNEIVDVQVGKYIPEVMRHEFSIFKIY
jgi:hypothetical protein